MSDILSKIDDATEGRCACGCGKHLDPDGPSQWYATPECQQRYLGQQATDPHAVYSRPDAAYAYVGADHLDVPLSGGTGWVGEHLTRLMRDAEPPRIGTAFTTTARAMTVNGFDVSDVVRQVEITTGEDSEPAPVEAERLRQFAEALGSPLTDWQANIIDETAWLHAQRQIELAVLHEDARRLWLNDRVRYRVTMDQYGDLTFTPEPVEESEHE